MLKKDYIIRQFEEFGKFLGIVFGLKTNQKWTEIEELINTSAQKFTSVELHEIEKISHEDLMETLITKKDLKEPQLKMLGDLLYEKGIAYSKQWKENEADVALRKAMLIYTYIKNNSLEIDFSLDMHFKMKSIEQMLDPQ